MAAATPCRQSTIHPAPWHPDRESRRERRMRSPVRSILVSSMTTVFTLGTLGPRWMFLAPTLEIGPTGSTVTAPPDEAAEQNSLPDGRKVTQQHDQPIHAEA